ncbi:MAG TPA: alpha/beta hydrolase [Gemmatimonadales bacterium]|nr:alpha/beta hydrolase [Gemmatimonadales bacterium]
MTTVRSADGVPITFQVIGTGEPTVVLVHGWATGHRLWDGQVPRLAARRRVVTLDLAGHGASGGGRAAWSIAGFGRDVEAVVEAVGAKQVVLVGHSMGGLVVLEAARRMPNRVNGIVLVDMLLNAEERTPPEQIEGAAKQLEADYRNATTRMANQYLFSPATPNAVRDRVLGGAFALSPGDSIAMLRETWAYDPIPALREIGVPIRGVNADKFPTDLVVNRRHMPGYDAIIIPGSGHYPMLEDPARFDPALERAIEGVLEKAG